MTKTPLTFPARKSPLVRYSVAILLVIGVTWLRLPLEALLGNSVPFILYSPALVVAGWFGGFGPGLVATLLSGYCAKTWFFEPVGAFSIDNWPSAFRLLLFLLSGLLMSFLCGRLHQRTEQLANEKAALEQKVKHRTVHLERSLQDMEAFSATVSHDLRAPLRSMVSYSEALLEDYADILPGDAREQLQRIRNSAGRLGRLIDDLLTFARVSGASVELRPVSLGNAVASVLQSLPQHTSAAVRLGSDGCDASVLANETLLHQVIQNLLDNAAKFVPPGTRPEITLWSEQRHQSVRIWVSDNGIGITPEHQKRLFKMFERIEPATYPGTGIGLAIVERAVAKMNGRVGVESDPGKGSKFWIELPAAHAQLSTAKIS